MKLRILVLSLMLTTFVSGMFAQESKMQAIQFYNDESDFTATLGNYLKISDDGETCSIVKVKTLETGFSFETGNFYQPKHVEQKVNEIWVWVNPRAKMLIIKHPSFGNLTVDVPDNGKFEEGNVWVLELDTPKKQQEKIKHECTVVVKSDKGDSVYVNDSLVGRINNSTTKGYALKLEPGYYEVKVKHDEYEKTSKLHIYENDTYVPPIEFKFSKKCNIRTDNINAGDKVFIDGIYRGIAGQDFVLSYGKHVISAKRSDGKYNETIKEIKPSETDDDDDEYDEPVYLVLLTPQKHFTNKPLVFATLDFGVGFLDFNSDNGYVTPYLQKNYGLTVGSVGKVGWYFSVMTNFDFKAFHPDYFAEGNYYYQNNLNQYGDFVDGYYPFYSGESRGSRLSIMAGLLLKMGSRGCFRFGAGYGHRAYAFSDLDGKWIAPKRYDKRGLDLALGMQFNNKSNVVFSFDIVSTSFSTIEAKVGLGVCLHKDKVFKMDY